MKLHSDVSWDSVPLSVLEGVACAVFYEHGEWLHGLDQPDNRRLVYEELLDHLHAWATATTKQDEIDVISGLHHVWIAGAKLVYLLYYDKYIKGSGSYGL